MIQELVSRHQISAAIGDCFTVFDCVVSQVLIFTKVTTPDHKDHTLVERCTTFWNVGTILLSKLLRIEISLTK